MSAPILAVDFGTSNSAAAVLDGGEVWRLDLARKADTVPTAVFFPADSNRMLIGHDAVRALIAGDEGRFMRALKSILGTPLFHESRLIGGKRRTLADVVTAFLVDLRERAEDAVGEEITHVLSGRPVHFHSGDVERDEKAEMDLRACYVAAGFKHVDFLFEPEAAAYAARATIPAAHLSGDRLGLIVDIGGGTSDFSVFRLDGEGISILASHGIRLGGTDFDQAVSMDHAMPLLGLGGSLRRTFGSGLLPVPRAIYFDLATWAKIPFVYSPDSHRLVADMLKHAVEGDKIERLKEVLDLELGHSLAFAVEKGKIAANSGDYGARIEMGFIERGLAAPVGPDNLASSLAGYRNRLGEAMAQTLTLAGVEPEAIGAVVLVGGSSLMTMVSDAARDICPAAEQSRADAFTAVVDGLAIATGTMAASE